MVVPRHVYCEVYRGHFDYVCRQFWPSLVSGLAYFRLVVIMHGLNNDVHRWGLIFGILISAIFLPFVITVYAFTGFSPNIQHLVQMVGAAVIPGNLQANMYFMLY